MIHESLCDDGRARADRKEESSSSGSSDDGSDTDMDDRPHRRVAPVKAAAAVCAAAAKKGIRDRPLFGGGSRLISLFNTKQQNALTWLYVRGLGRHQLQPRETMAKELQKLHQDTQAIRHDVGDLSTSERGDIPAATAGTAPNSQVTAQVELCNLARLQFLNRQFSRVCKHKVVVFIHEIVALLLLPWILYRWMPARAGTILRFVRSESVVDPELGLVLRRSLPPIQNVVTLGQRN
jgi:hypothetical protein